MVLPPDTWYFYIANFSWLCAYAWSLFACPLLAMFEEVIQLLVQSVIATYADSVGMDTGCIGLIVYRSGNDSHKHVTHVLRL